MTFDKLRNLIESIRHEVGCGATEADISRAESELGCTIRGDYREFLKVFGWGGPGEWELYGLGVDVPGYLDLVKITKSERSEMVPRLPAHLLPILNNGSGDLYCLDLSKRGPAVVLWSHEDGENQEPHIEGTDFTEWFLAFLQGSGRNSVL